MFLCAQLQVENLSAWGPYQLARMLSAPENGSVLFVELTRQVGRRNICRFCLK
ncbi:hypothetical protein M5D96_002687 [Drosophila gunungcola]|uniref:Uncharacterized protein n=1 Tax=Drosophila gunungcola TaxID=103775 RepID=A0A9Q0BVV4_9MUSC|nr:hypothetical protein M5D96_002687 [Drosophila gunungcola]